MHILRLTASLSIASLSAAPFWFSGNAFSQSVIQRQAAPTLVSQMSTGTSPGASQTTTTGQSVGTSQPSYTSTPGTTLQTPGASLTSPGLTQSTPGNTLQSPGASLSSPGATQTTNGQATGSGQVPSSGAANTGITQSLNGQPVQPTPASTTGVTGITQTPLNGQPAGSTQTAPAGSSDSSNPTSVLNPPQLLQGGVAVPPAQPSTSQPATNTAPTLRPQTTPSTATRTVTSGSSQLSPTQLQPGQGSLDAALQQAVCAQSWQQAIRVVNTAIAATPTSQSGYRSQLVSYRSRLQTLQAKGVQAPNWAQQCRGGAVANTAEQ